MFIARRVTSVLSTSDHFPVSAHRRVTVAARAAAVAALALGLLVPVATAQAASVAAAAGDGTADDGGGDGRVTFGMTTASGGTADDRGFIAVDAPPGSVLFDNVAVVNVSDAPLDVDLYSADVINTEDGELDAGGRGDPKTLAGAWLTLGGDKASLPAQSSKSGPGLSVVPVTINIPKDAEPGDHLAAVLSSVTAQGRAGENTPAVDLEHRVGVRVYVRVQGDIRAGLTITDVTAHFLAGGAFGAGKLQVQYTLTNSGNVRYGLNPSVRASGIFGLMPHTADGAPIEELLPHSVVKQTVTVEGVVPLLLQNVVVSATAVAARGAEDPGIGTVRASTWTWIWSWLVLVIFLVVAAIATTVVLRRRRNRPGTWGPPTDLWGGSSSAPPGGGDHGGIMPRAPGPDAGDGHVPAHGGTPDRPHGAPEPSPSHAHHGEPGPGSEREPVR